MYWHPASSLWNLSHGWLHSRHATVAPVSRYYYSQLRKATEVICQRLEFRWQRPRLESSVGSHITCQSMPRPASWSTCHMVQRPGHFLLLLSCFLSRKMLFWMEEDSHREMCCWHQFPLIGQWCPPSGPGDISRLGFSQCFPTQETDFRPDSQPSSSGLLEEQTFLFAKWETLNRISRRVWYREGDKNGKEEFRGHWIGIGKGPLCVESGVFLGADSEDPGI